MLERKLEVIIYWNIVRSIEYQYFKLFMNMFLFGLYSKMKNMKNFLFIILPEVLICIKLLSSNKPMCNLLRFN